METDEGAPPPMPSDALSPGWQSVQHCDNPAPLQGALWHCQQAAALSRPAGLLVSWHDPGICQVPQAST
eukprot:1947157-Rhodomonas_salina.2